MRAGRKVSGTRREPRFDATPTPGMDLRLSADDRPGGLPDETNEPASRKAGRRRASAASSAAGGNSTPAGSSNAASAYCSADSGANSTTSDTYLRRGGGGSRSPKAANDDSHRGWRGQRSAGRSRGHSGGGGRRRGLLRRMAYWVAVLALWCGIGGLGVLIYVAAHLPPIQALEVPKRPPSVAIVGLQGAALATRGEMGGASIPLKDMPKFLPAAFLAIEDRR